MSGPSAASSSRLSEYIVRVPAPNDKKHYSVLKFNDSIKIDPSSWSSPGSTISMERVENRAITGGLPSVQEYGEGTEYGKAAREEARRKKLGRQSRHYSIDNQPWKMKIQEDGEVKERKLHSIREGSANKHADFWLFMKSGDEFEAYKVDDWHSFVPSITHKVLDIDEAEEEFQKRNRVMNQFALRAQIQDKLKTKEELDEEAANAVKAGLKIKDEASSGSEGDEEDKDNEDEDEGSSSSKKKKKVKKGAKPRKDKKVKVENADEVAKYESSDGEDEGREYDYMSDSGSDSEREDVPNEEKVEKALVGVAEEEGLKKMMDSDESDSDDDDLEKKLLNRKDDDDKKRHIDIEERDSSGSDSEVEDIEREKLEGILMPKKGTGGDGGGTSGGGQGVKRANEEGAKGPEAKKVKKEEKEEGLSEEMVRKLLRTKPHTTKELLSKIKSRCGAELPKPEMVTKLAAILKAIEPHQFKQKQGKKEVLFFSLSNTIS